MNETNDGYGTEKSCKAGCAILPTVSFAENLRESKNIFEGMWTA